MMNTLLVLAALLPGQDPNDPRVRRYHREAVVNRLGNVARSLVETHGDLAVAALNRCDRDSGIRLCQMHNNGKLDDVPRPKALLACIAQANHGTDVANWICLHADELAKDPFAFEAFLRPGQALEISLSLKTLEEAKAAPVPRLRLPEAASDIDFGAWQTWVVIWLVIGSVGIAARRWRGRRSVPGP